MLTHSSEILTLIKLRNREGNIFHSLPKDIIKSMIAPLPIIDPETDIEELLHYVAYGDPEAVKAILSKKPRLLIQSGNVTAPSGDLILSTTAFKCAIGAGDHGMAKIIKSYFPKIENGEQEAIKQFSAYEINIKNILHQSYYDLSGLMEILLKSSEKDVKFVLDCNWSHESELSKAITEFRKHFIPRVITEGMHFNYANLQHALSIYEHEFNKLQNKGWDFTCVFEILVIGYIKRGLAACDRQAFTQGIYYIVDEGKQLQRSFQCQLSGKEFPVTAGDNSCDGLGYKDNGSMGAGSRINGSVPFNKLITDKSTQLAELMEQQAPIQRMDCVIF